MENPTMSNSNFQLSLLRFVYDRLGFQTPSDATEDGPFERISEDFQHRETGQFGGLQTEYEPIAVRVFKGPESVLTPKKIREYDENIKSHLETINESRTNTIRLRYYQYLSLFFTEYVLDQLSSDKSSFIDQYNQFIKDEFKTLDSSPLSIQQDTGLNKLAYWMATGSGKTFVLHFNFLQYKHYFGKEFSNAILIAPNERIAEQHLEELDANGIQSQPLDIDQTPDDGVLEVTDVHKLSRDRGEKTFDVDSLGDDNIVFVDEGHKGLSSISSSNTGWKSLRDDLSVNGFAFEYSATFASSLSTEEGYQEYSKSIAFDYSYGRFHSDRYGKDFDIINIDPKEHGDYIEEQQQEWLLANLLTYYEKVRIYEENDDLSQEHKIEKPLSLFVGSSVKAIQRGGKSDVQVVVEFLDSVIQNQDEWVHRSLRKMNNQDGIFEPDGLFGEKFDYLLNENLSCKEIYHDLIERLFDSGKNASRLHLHRLKNGEGEIGLTTTDTNEFFGAITVGDAGSFIDLINDESSLPTQEIETYTGSLFEEVDKPNSSVNFLIGSRKFAEGWDSVRPSTMGLLNIGRSKGPVVVQMFGRGVRVNGTDSDGKRADLKTIHGSEYEQLSRLETLDVFGVRADYIETFKNHLESERIDFGNTNTTTVNVPITRDVPDTDLYVPTRNTEIEEDIISPTTLSDALHRYGTDDKRKIQPTIDLLVSGTRLTRDEEDGVEEAEIEEDSNYVVIERDLTFRGEDLSIDALDWDRIWRDVTTYKREQEYTELIIDHAGIRKAITDRFYYLHATEDRLQLQQFEELPRVEALCVRVLNRVLDKVYEQMLADTETESIQLSKLTESWMDEKTPNSYQIQVDMNSDKSEALVQHLDTLDLDNISEDLKPLLYVMNQLYRPVFVNSDLVDTDVGKLLQSVSPEGIDVESEHKFIKEVEAAFETSGGALHEQEAVIMRNQSQNGLGFKSGGNYYPDFVMWVSDGDTQHVVFIDPKGLRYGSVSMEAKIEFGKSIREISENTGNDLSQDVQLHSYILTDTSKEDVDDEWYSYFSNNYDGEPQNANVYFLNDQGIEAVIQDVLQTTKN